jgi:hypothetical protein
MCVQLLHLKDNTFCIALISYFDGLINFKFYFSIYIPTYSTNCDISLKRRKVNAFFKLLVLFVI